MTGADTLEEMAGIRLSESTVERTTEDVGRRLAEMVGQDQTAGPAVQWEWHLDALGHKVAYFTTDATGTRQQGPGGKEAEDRMAYVAGVYDPTPVDWPLPPGKKPPVMQARYLSGPYSLDEMGPLLRRQAARVGMEDAEVWVALTDGGNGLEAFCRENFDRPDLVLIPDFYHAASYLDALAKALLPQEEEAKAQAERWCRLLKEEGRAMTLAVLEDVEWPARESAALKEQLGTTRRYFANDVHRMEYPEYLAKGWQIGSGVEESACKTVVGQRMKGAGMRWSVAGAHALCHVRASYRSEKGQWDAFWKRQFTKRVPVQQEKVTLTLPGCHVRLELALSDPEHDSRLVPVQPPQLEYMARGATVLQEPPVRAEGKPIPDERPPPLQRRDQAVVLHPSDGDAAVLVAAGVTGVIRRESQDVTVEGPTLPLAEDFRVGQHEARDGPIAQFRQRPPLRHRQRQRPADGRGRLEALPATLAQSDAPRLRQLRPPEL